ncbi:MAG: hypothetical protein RLZZ546_1203 [Bacteroidota bacterium]|jgi:UDP-N-acetylmuramate--alanine ligase
MSHDFENIKNIFFIGIGGIGMSALARYFNTRGIKVSGYDKTETALTKKLIEEGIDIHYQDDISLLPRHIDLAVYTPAIPSNHTQLVHLMNIGCPLMKRAEVLGLISKMQKTIAVAGTHGKTTTSSMVTHTLLSCNEEVSAFLGGIMSGYETNYFLGNGEWVVVEADEFDRSFLHLMPDITAVNSLDADHLDIYGTHDKVRDSYLTFMNKTAEGGYLLLNESVWKELTEIELSSLKNKYKVYSYGYEDGCDIQLQILKMGEGKVVFDYMSPFGSIQQVSLKMPGLHNVSNASVAISVALILGKHKDAIANAIASFKGIKRRFETIVDLDKKVYIDDYAHHPTELKMAIQAAKMMYPGKKVLGIFQPHLFTRTRDFLEDFAKELSQLDEIVLMEIYPARELPIEGITSELLLSKIENTNKSLLDEEAILSKIVEKNFDVVMTLGAGNIDLLVPKIKALLT